MIVRYTETSLDEIDEMLNYIARERPSAAKQLSQAIESAIVAIIAEPSAAPIVCGRTVRAKLLRRYQIRIFYEK
jgi:plasmid stabilization system protein ParE